MGLRKEKKFSTLGGRAEQHGRALRWPLMLSHATLDHRISHGALGHGRKPGGNRIDDGLAFAAE
jgi:hypothetical protein